MREHITKAMTGGKRVPIGPINSQCILGSYEPVHENLNLIALSSNKSIDINEGLELKPC